MGEVSINAFDWSVAIIVVASLVYLSFVLTLADWLSALRQGQAVSLLPEREGRQPPLWTQIAMVIFGLALVVVMIYYLWIPLLVFPTITARVLDLVGLALYLIGLWFTLWARRTLGKYWGISTSQQVKLLDDHQLIQRGPYAFVRHPMYFGWWLAMLGLTLIYPVWMLLILFASSVLAFVGRARREETALAERFGRDWEAYAAQTRFLIPFVY